MFYFLGVGTGGSLTIVLRNSNGCFQSGIYPLYVAAGKGAASYIDYDRDMDKDYLTDSIHYGSLYIHIDTVKQRISDSFSLVAKYRSDTTTVNVTQWQFFGTIQNSLSASRAFFARCGGPFVVCRFH